MLIRVYTDQGRRDMAQLVWRFGKGRGAVEGEAYDAQHYALEAWSAGPQEAPAPAAEEAGRRRGATCRRRGATCRRRGATCAAEEPPPIEKPPAAAIEKPSATVEWQPAAIEPPPDADEAAILSAAARAGREGHYEDAAREMRRLGPVEKLSPAALDMLIRLYTSEGEVGRADLVWRYGKNRGLVEGESYDAQRYALEGPPVEPGEPAAPEKEAAFAADESPVSAEASSAVADEPPAAADETPAAADEPPRVVDEPASVTARGATCRRGARDRRSRAALRGRAATRRR